MNQAHYHLIFNHLPFIVPIIGLLVMIGGHVFHSEIVKRTAFCIFIAGALCTIPAIATGEGAEEIVEELGGISHKLIHNHEEIAEKFALVSYLLGLISIVGLWANWKQKSFANILSFVSLFVCIVALYLAKETGTSGGEIRHTEIRKENKSVEIKKVQESEEDNDDDDV